MGRFSFNYRGKIAFLAVGLVIALASMFYSNYLAGELAYKEKNEIQLWSRGITLINNFDPRSVAEKDIIGQITDTLSIPAIITDQYLRVVFAQDVSQKTLSDPKALRAKLEEMATGRNPIQFDTPNGETMTVYYDDSALLKSIYFFPFIQLSVIGVFICLAYITFRSSRLSEQNRVWIGMAKETAHQLGTPTSSLLGWVEYLKSQNIDPEVVEEMGNDIKRLMKVADRFGKIGSSTQLMPRNVWDVVAATVKYFQSRIPRNVTLEMEQCTAEPLQAMVNDALFEWVIENLLKNGLDALQGQGSIRVNISSRDKWVRVDVTDTGKGMTKYNFKRIFRPGFTTKTRGWGLGLSLSKRIIEEYHHGRIFVKESEVGVGTTFRILLRKL